VTATDSQSIAWNAQDFAAEAAEILRKYLFYFPGSAGDVSNFTAAVDGKRQLHDRRFYPVHIVTSGFVLSPDRGSVLLIDPRGQSRWRQPFGHYVPPATLPQSALRSVREETQIPKPDLHVWHERTGIPVDIGEYSVPAGSGTGEPAHIHIDLRYVFVATSRRLAETDGGETDGVAFLPVDRLATLAPGVYERLRFFV